YLRLEMTTSGAGNLVSGFGSLLCRCKNMSDTPPNIALTCVELAKASPSSTAGWIGRSTNSVKIASSTNRCRRVRKRYDRMGADSLRKTCSKPNMNTLSFDGADLQPLKRLGDGLSAR